MSTPSAAPKVRHPRRTIAALCIGTALSALNAGMIAVALVTIRSDFTLDVATVTWVITSYYLASAALQPLMGRLADRYGPRRLFTFGMSVNVLTGVLTPFAPTFWLVCAGRVLLAVGMSTAFPAAAAIALISVLIMAPPDGVVLKESPLQTIIDSDVPGILTFSATIIALLMFLLGLPAHPNWWLIVVSLAAAVLFVWRELRCAKPFIDLRLLAANNRLVRVYVCFILVNLAFYTVLFGLPQLLEEHAHYSSDVVGLLIIPLAAFTIVLSPFVERMIDARGLRFALIVGGVGAVLGAAITGALALSTAPIVVLLVCAAVGIPYCVLVISLTQALYVAAPAGQSGEAAGLFQTAKCLAGISSTVIVGVSFSSGTTQTNWILIAGSITVLAVAYLVLVIVWGRRSASQQWRKVGLVADSNGAAA
ncbi:MAG: MFS transporter [Microbacteriaceae bacterium]